MKKITAIVMAMVIAMSCLVPAYATDSVKEETTEQVVTVESFLENIISAIEDFLEAVLVGLGIIEPEHTDTKDAYEVGEPEPVLPVKLVPINESSTAMINRGHFYKFYEKTSTEGTVESYADGFEVVTETYDYEYPESFDLWFLYGLDEQVTEEELFTEYVKVQGDGYAVVTKSDETYVGTGSYVEVYNGNGTDDASDDFLVEAFNVVIFGDINGNGVVDDNDVSMVRDEIGGVTSWSGRWGEDEEYRPYLKLAADANRDNFISTADTTAIREHIADYSELTQCPDELFRSIFIH